MRFLILAAALACTASPALGQVRQELRERGKLGNVSAQTRLELMYDIGRDGTAERCGGPVSWERILIGAGIGFAAGFGILGTWKLPANAENRVSFRGSRQRLVRLIP